MFQSMIVLFFLFILFSLTLAINKPTYFVIFYLLSSTRFLGFFDLDYYFIFFDIKIGMTILNIIALLSIFNATWYILPRKNLFIIIFFLIFLSFGIFYPLLFNYQSVFPKILELSRVS